MKSAEEVLEELYNSDKHKMADWPFHSQLDFVLDAMIAYAQQAIEEDRKIVAENAKVTKVDNSKYGSEDEHWYMDEYGDSSTIVACKKSIINAPKLELK